MRQWELLVAAALAACITNLVSVWIVKRLKAAKYVTYEVSPFSGKRQEITISQSKGDDIDSRVQRVIFEALNVMRRSPLNSKSTLELKRLIEELEKQRARNPMSSRINLLLGRAYRNLGKLQRSIEIISGYIAAKEREGQLDRPLSIALYNRACYYSLSGLAELAAADLEKSETLDPGKLETAAEDPDFDKVRARLSNLIPARTNA